MAAIVTGGLLDVTLFDDAGNNVIADKISNDFVITQTNNKKSLANAQTLVSTKKHVLEFFAIELSSTELTQLETWEKDNTEVNAVLQGFDFIRNWAEPSLVSLDIITDNMDELIGYKLALEVSK